MAWGAIIQPAAYYRIAHRSDRRSGTDAIAPYRPYAYHVLMPQDTPQKRLSYRDAGVDIDVGNRLVARIRQLADVTHRHGALGSIGGFGALFDIGALRYAQPVLVASTDGVGSKVLLAARSGRHADIGIDLVAMCVNDVAVQGAEPLFFLDYVACNRLREDTVAALVEGIAAGCRSAGAALIGGETAEMPDCYREGEYDLAGFCVGACEKERVLDGTRAHAGDVLIGLASSGAHANGYSLVRKILERAGISIDADAAERWPLRELLAPTRIYVSALRALLDAVPVRGLAHVTGGGLVDNVPRMLPEALGAVIDPASWERPALFRWLEEQGGIAAGEMWRTFNCGVGMVACVPEPQAERAIACLSEAGERAWRIGRVEHVSGSSRVRFSA